jgi:hypothetical protein
MACRLFCLFSQTPIAINPPPTIYLFQHGFEPLAPKKTNLSPPAPMIFFETPQNIRGRLSTHVARPKYRLSLMGWVYGVSFLSFHAHAHAIRGRSCGPSRALLLASCSLSLSVSVSFCVCFSMSGIYVPSPPQPVWRFVSFFRPYLFFFLALFGERCVWGRATGRGGRLRKRQNEVTSGTVPLMDSSPWPWRVGSLEGVMCT